MKVLLLDGYNMLHRCRFNWGGGKAEGEHQITYNFMRLLKSTIDDFKPDDVYFVIDGKPVKRLEAFPAYKENRREEITDPEEIAYWESYHRQKRNCLKFLREDLPVITAYHKDYEADDVIYHLAKNKFTSDDEVIIISSDTDYIQICGELDYVKLFNPIKRDVNDIEYTEKLFNLDLLKEEFQTMEFQSMLEESYLSDYEDTFKTLL
jgi:5'-3' exonuclease